MTGSSSSSSNSSSSSSVNSNDRRTTPKSKSTDCNESSKLNFKPYELTNRNKFNESDKKGTPSPGKSTPNTSSANNKAQLISPGSESHRQQTNTSNSAPLSYTSLGLPDMHKDSLAAFYKAYGFLNPNCCPPNAGSPYANMMPPPITLDKTGAYPSIYPPTPSATAAAAIAAYNYARVKGGMGMMPGGGNPLCRDPYCGGACSQFGPMGHNSHAALLAASSASLALRDAGALSSATSTCTPATCPNGCNQCEHQRYMAAIAAAYSNSFQGMNPGGYPSSVSASYLSSLAATAALHHRAPSAAGNVCNWVVGDSHCGKRFTTSEELLQHLKSHTNSSQQASESNTSTSSTPTNTSASHSSTSQHTSSGTPSPLSQSTRLSTSSGTTANGTSPSPVPHNLSLHNNRYHPYSKPITSGPSSLPPNNPFNPANGPPYQPSAFAGLSPSLPSFVSPNLYYPYMTPGLFSGRIGPPVPP